MPRPVFIVLFPHVQFTYTFALDKLTLRSLRKRRHTLKLFFPRSTMALKPALPFWKILNFMFLQAIVGTSHCLVFVPLINPIPVFGAPVLSTLWVNIRTYLRSEPFLCHIYTHLPKIVNLFCSKSLCSVLCSS
jgi:hypothetical protein